MLEASPRRSWSALLSCGPGFATVFLLALAIPAVQGSHASVNGAVTPSGVVGPAGEAVLLLQPDPDEAPRRWVLAQYDPAGLHLRDTPLEIDAVDYGARAVAMDHAGVVSVAVDCAYWGKGADCDSLLRVAPDGSVERSGRGDVARPVREVKIGEVTISLSGSTLIRSGGSGQELSRQELEHAILRARPTWDGDPLLVGPDDPPEALMVAFRIFDTDRLAGWIADLRPSVLSLLRDDDILSASLAERLCATQGEAARLEILRRYDRSEGSRKDGLLGALAVCFDQPPAGALEHLGRLQSGASESPLVGLTHEAIRRWGRLAAPPVR